MLDGKFKFCTFVHPSVLPSVRFSKGFAAALMFLPELYAAALNPRSRSDILQALDGLRWERALDRWNLVSAVHEENQWLREAIEGANRIEMALKPYNSNIEGIITFHHGATTLEFHIRFTVPVHYPTPIKSDPEYGRTDWIVAECKW